MLPPPPQQSRRRDDGVLASQQLSTVIPREGSFAASRPQVFRALGFASARGTDASGLICAFDTEKTTVLCCPLAAESADVTSANDLAALLALTRFGGSHSADDDGEEADDEEEDEDGLEDRAEGEEGAVAPAVGSVLALWRTQEQRHWPCVVTDRMAVLAHSGKRGRATGEQHRFACATLPTRRARCLLSAQRSSWMDGHFACCALAIVRRTRQRDEREARAARESEVAVPRAGAAAPPAPPAPPQPQPPAVHRLVHLPTAAAPSLSVRPAFQFGRLAALSAEPWPRTKGCGRGRSGACPGGRAWLAAAAVKAAEAARGGKASKGDDASMDAHGGGGGGAEATQYIRLGGCERQQQWQRGQRCWTQRGVCRGGSHRPSAAAARRGGRRSGGEGGEASAEAEVSGAPVDSKVCLEGGCARDSTYPADARVARAAHLVARRRGRRARGRDALSALP